MKSEILWSEIYAVHSEDKILQDAVQCSHYTGLWYLLKHTAASSKACGNNREKDEPLSEVPWCLHGIHLSKASPEAPSWRQHWNGENIWTQKGSAVSFFLTQDIQTSISHLMSMTQSKAGGQGSFLDLALSCKQSWRDLLGGKRKGVQGPRCCSLLLASLS